MMTRGDMGATPSRRGIALVIVLGMLALMMLLGVSFSVFMRTERLAAGYFKNDMRVRNLLAAGLHRAMCETDAYMTNRSLVYPDWDVYVPPSGVALDNMRIFTNGFSAYIPASLLPAVSAATSRWQNLPNSAEGRYAYVVLNCSGLVDGNYAGGAARAFGTNANELALSKLPEVRNVSGFISQRGVHRRYESMRELGVLQTNNISPWPASMVAYSRFPTGYLSRGDGTVHAPEANIGGDPETWDEQRTNDIVNGFVQCLGVSADDAQEIYTNLLDYTDADNIPRDLGSPTTESVPMINEIKVETSLEWNGTGDRVRTKMSVWIETAYPFVRPSPDEFMVRYDIAVTPDGGTPVQLVPTSRDPASPYDSEYVPNHPNYVNWYKATEVLCESQPQPATSVVGRAVQFTVRVGAQVLKSDTGEVVDSAPFPFVSNSYLRIQTPAGITVSPYSGSASQPCGSPVGWECIDPRFNWDFVEDFCWQRYFPGFSGTLDAPNFAATNWMADYAGDVDGTRSADMVMYVADSPIRTVGELSYLIRSGMPEAGNWTTIRLVDNGPIPLDPVLDHFYTETNAVMRGRINPNTRSRPALRSVLYGMPIDDHPGSVGTAFVDDSMADALATEMLRLAGSFTNLSDLGHATNLMNRCSPGGSVFRREAFVRNTCGLFHPRQNYFVVLIVAQVTEDVFLQTGVRRTTVRAVERAVADVWRDPYPRNVMTQPGVTNMMHPAFVRLFKIIEE